MPNANEQMRSVANSGGRVDDKPYTNYEGEEAYLVYGCAGYLSGTVVKTKYGVWCADRGDGDKFYYLTKEEAVFRIMELGDLLGI